MTRPPTPSRAASGFSLLEVLFAMIVIAVGLLGLLKGQALAVSSTHDSVERSLIAMQTGSLAAAMHGNTAFWLSGAAPAAFSASGDTVTDATGVLSGTALNCIASAKPAAPPCTPAQVAAFDVQTWARNLNAQFPTYRADATCTTSLTAPISCTVTVRWQQGYRSTTLGTVSDSDATGGSRSYSLHIEP